MQSQRVVLLVSVLVVALSRGPAIGGPPDAERLFESHIRPLLAGRCQECHGEKLAESGLRLDSRKALLAGGDGGPIVVPGDAGKSRLIAAVRHLGEVAMPPDGRLADDQIRLLEDWIAAGAAWSGPGGDDDPSAAGGRGADMQQRLDDALRTHWAFRPPVAHTPPVLPENAAVPPGWNESAIDRFLLAPIVAAGLAPSPEAGPRELIRRLWYDLTGLPPPADAADAFVRDPSDEAYRAHAERLLASRQHAEHWARKWLDLARYADTMGYAFDNQDNRYPFAWTYRDWVIGALARDLPLDRFITLQLAADLVEPPAEKSDLAALGFLTCGRSFLGNTNDIIDDRIDLVTRGLMGLTVACARCHDHKYEPVTTADYYALHGIFSSAQVPEELPVIGAPPPGAEAEAFEKKLAELKQAVADLETARPTPRGPEGTTLIGPKADAMRVATRAEETELRRRKKQVTAHFAESPGGPPRAMVLVDREKPHDSRIFIRGNPSRPGEVVKRRLPAVLGGHEVSDESSGRLDLARAIVSPDNPLTARTIVNWVWTHHFGRGLVETPGDLGLRGEPPSHPQLLDDLARRFIEEGGSSLRWLHREIVCSRAFRQSSVIRPELAARDPDNRLFARANRRRLEWESWRDSLLVAAGTLDVDHPGGRGVDPLALESMHVRSIYARLDRQDVPGILRVFDVANPDTAVHVRPRTSVPQQSLAVLNAPLAVEAASRATARVSRELGDCSNESAWAEALWRAVLGRSPTAEEQAIAEAWLAREARVEEGDAAGVDHHARFAHALMATAEFHHVD